MMITIGDNYDDNYDGKNMINYDDILLYTMSLSQVLPIIYHTSCNNNNNNYHYQDDRDSVDLWIYLLSAEDRH